MASVSQPPQDDNWEKQYAPRVTGKSLAVSVAIYCAWIVFLAVLAVGRWPGVLG